jgi:periplasmic copper chaperone A
MGSRFMLKHIWFGFGLLVLSLTATAGESIVVADAWIPEAPPVAMMNAGYLRITNHGKQPVVIVAVKSDAYGDVEMHKSVTKDGMARMIKQDEITIAPGQEIKFERGGLHLMLMEPKRPLKIGDQAKMVLITKDKQTVNFTATVKAATLGDTDHSHHQH